MTGIAVCLANAPRQLPTAHAVEAGGVLDPERGIYIRSARSPARL